jgi:hypothetical protein
MGSRSESRKLFQLLIELRHQDSGDWSSKTRFHKQNSLREEEFGTTAYSEQRLRRNQDACHTSLAPFTAGSQSLSVF